MKKQLLLLLMTLLGAAQTVCAQELYVALNFTQQATIYYDDQKEARYGESMELAKYTDKFDYVTTIVFDASVKNYYPVFLNLWFKDWTRLKTFEHLDYLNTDDVVSMQAMFHNCQALESIDLSSFKTSKVTNMEGMFAYCTSLKSVNLSGFDTSEVTDMSGMFAECTSLTSVNISSFNTAKVTNMSSMFYNCQSLQEVDVSHFKTTALTNMMSMFENCSELDHIDLSNANTSAVTDMSHLFYGCESLNTIYADEVKWSTAAVTESTDMFKNCYNLCGYGSDYGTCYQYLKVADATYARVDSNTTPGYLTQKNGPSGGDPEPYAVLLAGNKRLVFCYDGNKEDRGGLDIGPFTAESTRWGGHAADITEVCFQEDFANARPTSTAYWFKGMTYLGYIQDLAKLNTSEVTDMSYMFADTKNIYELNLSTLNTAKVTSMKGMFSGSSLSYFDGSKFKTQNVTDMSYMFADSQMSSFNLRNFNTENVTDMSYMFQNLYNLYTLDLLYFNTSKVTNMEGMFYECYILNTIYADEDSWSTASVTNSSNMFYGCNNLQGSKGTKYDDVHNDAEYARVDKEGQPGYLSAKAPSAYAALSNDNTVLTFYYDNKKEKRGGLGIGPFYGNYGLEASTWNGHRETLRELVFDSSFAAYKNLTSTRNWFLYCQFTTITGIENLNTDNVTDMFDMFCGCNQLTTIDVSHFNTSRVKNMNGMFYGCSAMESIDVSGFNTSNVTDMANMFNGCSALQTIYSDDTWTCSKSTNMFKNCTSLKGAIEYDASKLDVTYANPDTGYFTCKNPKCAKPVITMKDGKLVLSCSTEGVTYKSSISKPVTGNSFTLNDTYTLSVYATKEGFADSEVVTAEIQLKDKTGASEYKKGDVNEDGVVSITDAVSVVNIILNNGESVSAPQIELADPVAQPE